MYLEGPNVVAEDPIRIYTRKIREGKREGPWRTRLAPRLGRLGAVPPYAMSKNPRLLSIGAQSSSRLGPREFSSCLFCWYSCWPCSSTVLSFPLELIATPIQNFRERRHPCWVLDIDHHPLHFVSSIRQLTSICESPCIRRFRSWFWPPAVWCLWPKRLLKIWARQSVSPSAELSAWTR